MDSIAVQFSTWFFALLSLGFFIRMAVMRRTEGRLLDKQTRLQNQIDSQQMETMRVRQDSATWRSSMQHQYDAYRSTSSSHLAGTEARCGALERQLADMVNQAEKRESELQIALGKVLQVCGPEPELVTEIIAPMPVPAAPSAGLDDLRAALAASQQKVSALQTALLIARAKAKRSAAAAKRPHCRIV